MLKYKLLQKKLIVDTKKIAILKFLLEGYDGMALLTTLDSATGSVLIRYVPSFEKDLDIILCNFQIN